MNADEKTCPMCAETVKRDALICRYCNHVFDILEAGDPGIEWLETSFPTPRQSVDLGSAHEDPGDQWLRDNLRSDQKFVPVTKTKTPERKEHGGLFWVVVIASGIIVGGIVLYILFGMPVEGARHRYRL